jgi:hypothetical protein
MNQSTRWLWLGMAGKFQFLLSIFIVILISPVQLQAARITDMIKSKITIRIKIESKQPVISVRPICLGLLLILAAWNC